MPLSANELKARGLRSYPQDKKTVFLATLKAFELMGYDITLANTETGTIRTGHGSATRTYQGISTLTWNVSLRENSESGQVELLAQPTAYLNMAMYTSGLVASQVDPHFTLLWREISAMVGEVDAIAKAKHSQDSSGTCFVTASGKVVTAYHVIEGRPSITVQYHDKSIFQATVVASSEEDDIVILTTDKKGQDGLAVVPSSTLQIGDSTFTIGFPTPDVLGWEPKYTDGAISATSIGGDTKHFQISVPVQPGNSGGPLLTKAGEVVGVIVAKMDSGKFDNVGFAVKSEQLLALLGETPAKAQSEVGDGVARSVSERTCRIVASAKETPAEAPEKSPTKVDWPE